VAGDEIAQAIEIGLGHEVVEYVDHHAGTADSSGMGGRGERPRTVGIAPNGD
jgi:hypothetical protein